MFRLQNSLSFYASNNNMYQSSTNSTDVAPDFMSNRQIKHVIVVKDGVNLEAKVSDTPATNFNDGKPRWRYHSGATDVAEGHPDNKLPRKSILQDGSPVKDHHPLNYRSFKGWTEINLKRNWEQTKVNCNHCHKLYSRASLNNHHKTSKCVNAKGRRFQVGVDAPDVMTNNQTIATTDGNDLTSQVTDTPATHYDDGKPKWRYASGATTLYSLTSEDNLLPRTALKKDGTTGKTFHTENVKGQTQGNYNKDGSFKGWTAINKNNNTRQSRVKCPHCNGFFKKGSLSKHQRSEKCVNADGVKFVVGEHVSHVTADGTEVMGRISAGNAPTKTQFATKKTGYRTSPTDWAGAEAYFAQLHPNVLAKLLVGEMADRCEDVTEHKISFNFTKPPTAPAGYTPSSASLIATKRDELDDCHEQIQDYADTKEDKIAEYTHQCKTLATSCQWEAIGLIVKEQTEFIKLETDLNVKLAELTDELEVMEEEATTTSFAHTRPRWLGYDLATEEPIAPVAIVKRKPTVAPTAEDVIET